MILAVDVGGTKLAAARVSPDGTIVATRRAATPQDADAETLWRALRELIGPLSGGVTGVGVGCGGPMAWPAGVVSPLNIPGWRGFPLRARLSALFPGVPVRVHNDAICLAVAEHWRGAGRGVADMLGMVVSTGVGGGLILGGRLVDGGTGNAGHIGHVVVEPDGGPPCGCGGHGCLEAVARGPALTAWALAHGWTPHSGTPTSRQPDDLGGAGPLPEEAATRERAVPSSAGEAPPQSWSGGGREGAGEAPPESRSGGGQEGAEEASPPQSWSGGVQEGAGEASPSQSWSGGGREGAEGLPGEGPPAGQPRSGGAVARGRVGAVGGGRGSFAGEADAYGGGYREERAVTGRMLAADARAGDEVAVAAMRRAGRALGIAIASATHLCDLELVTIGGGLSQAGEPLFGPLEEALREHARMEFARRLRVLPASLGQEAGLIGAAALIIAGDTY